MIEKGNLVFHKICYTEPDYPEDKETLRIIKNKAEAWNQQQKLSTPRTKTD